MFISLKYLDVLPLEIILKKPKKAAKEALTLWVKIKKKNPLEKCIIVPNYGDNQIIHAKTLENIIKQSGISEEKFFK